MFEKLQNHKINLNDVTFLMPIRIDSWQRKGNVDTSLNFIMNHFDTTFIIIEGDETKKFIPKSNLTKISYVFEEDHERYFHKTKYIKKLIELANTQFIAVWDSDVIVPVPQILESAKKLMRNEAMFCIPYDGRAYVCDEYISILFRKNPNIEILLKLASSFPLMYGYHSTGGAFIAHKQKYQENGGENENFLGWGPEDANRVKMLEVRNQKIHYSTGPLFHLWHPRGETSWYANLDSEKRNRFEFIKTCKFTVHD